MTVLLPDSSTTAEELASHLTADNWENWLRLRQEWRFDFALPKFRLHSALDIKPALCAMGMSSAFDPVSANFCRMFVDGEGWIDQALHNSFIQVDEKGTVAAAITRFYFADSLPPRMIVDRPFLIVISDDATGAVLFLAKIADPVWSS